MSNFFSVACRRWANVGPPVKKPLGRRRQPSSGRRMCRRWPDVGPMSACYLGRAHKLESHSHKLESRYHKIASHSHKLESHSHKIASHSHKILTHSHNLAKSSPQDFCGNELYPPGTRRHFDINDWSKLGPGAGFMESLKLR